MKSKSLLDRSFRYTPSFATNLKCTFDRVHRQMRQQANSAGKADPEVEGQCCLDGTHPDAAFRSTLQD